LVTRCKGLKISHLFFVNYSYKTLSKNIISILFIIHFDLDIFPSEHGDVPLDHMDVSKMVQMSLKERPKIDVPFGRHFGRRGYVFSSMSRERSVPTYKLHKKHNNEYNL